MVVAVNDSEQFAYGKINSLIIFQTYIGVNSHIRCIDIYFCHLHVPVAVYPYFYSQTLFYIATRSSKTLISEWAGRYLCDS